MVIKDSPIGTLLQARMMSFLRTAVLPLPDNDNVLLVKAEI